MPTLILIAAVARNRVIGRGNELVWRDPQDMAHFREMTRGHTVIMGRKTWESLPPRFRPLPDRRNVVITRQPNYLAVGAIVTSSPCSALALLKENETAFVIGGAEIYSQLISAADALELTEVDIYPEGDAYFPEIDPNSWQVTSRLPTQGEQAITFCFTRYVRIPHRHP